MPKLQYIGPHSSVTVKLPGGGTVTVQHGGTCEFPESLAKGLREQPDNWVAPAPPAPAPKDKPAKGDDTTTDEKAGS